MKHLVGYLGGSLACLIFLAAVYAQAGGTGWGHPDVVSKGVRFNLPAAGQVYVDAATNDSTLASDSSFRVDCDTSTSTNICSEVLYTARADTGVGGYYIGNYLSTTTAVAVTNANFFANYWQHTSTGADVGGAVFGWGATVTGGEAATEYTLIDVDTGFDNIVVARSGDIQAVGYVMEIRTSTGGAAIAGPNLSFEVAAGGGALVAGDYVYAYEDGGTGADDSDTIHTLNDTSQILLNHATIASSLPATAGSHQIDWKPAVTGERHADLIVWDASANATTGTSAHHIDGDDVEGGGLGAGEWQAAYSGVPSYSTADNATAVRAAFMGVPPAACNGVCSVVAARDGAFNRIVYTTDAGALVEVPSLRGSFSAYVATATEGSPFGGAYLDGSVTINGVTATWGVTGTNAGGQVVTFQVSCAAVVATCTLACDIAAWTPTRCTLTVNNAADQICTVQITAATNCAGNPTLISASVDYSQVP